MTLVPNVIAQDTFTRANTTSPSWGTATGGGAWTHPNGTATVYSVTSNEGVINSTPGTWDHFLLGTNTVNTTLDVVTRAIVDNTASMFGVLLRLSSNGLTSYKVMYNGAGALIMYYDSPGTGLVQIGSTSAFTVTVGSAYHVRGQINSGTLMGKIWLDGSAEPGSWTISASVGTNTITTGGYGILGNANNNLKFDNFIVSAPISIDSLPLRVRVSGRGLKSVGIRARIATKAVRSAVLRTVIATTTANKRSLALRAVINARPTRSLAMRLVAASRRQRSTVLRTRISALNARSLGIRAVITNPGTTYGITISGVSQFVIAGSLTVDNTIGRRGTAAFTLRTTTATHFQQYQPVSILDAMGHLVFSGYVTQPKEQKPGFRASLIHTITCVDQHYLADKRVIAATYTGKTCGYIVQDIVSQILSQEGVTVAQIIDSGVVIPSATFVYCSVAAALDALVTQASAAGIPYYWQIDQNKQLWFVPYTAVVNSTIVDGTAVDQTYNLATVQRQNPTYRNTQYILGGTAQTATQTESRPGDGVTTSWAMGYDLSTVPTITVSGVAKTVGIKGIDTGKDFYWSKGSPTITQDSSATVLTSAQTLRVVYVGQYPTVIQTAQSAQISYQASIDGSTGIVENVITDATLTSTANGLSEASQLLTRYAAQGTQLVFSTLVAGYAQGQLITVNLPDHGLNNVQMLIEDCSASDQVDGIHIWYQITCVLGPYDVSWVDFFSTLLRQQQEANAINVGVSQSLTLLQSFPATIGVQVRGLVSVYACPIPSTTLFPSTTLYPC